MEDEVAALVCTLLLALVPFRSNQNLPTGYRQRIWHVQGWLYVFSSVSTQIFADLCLTQSLVLTLHAMSVSLILTLRYR